MILLDAYALLAYLRDEAAAEEVEALLRDGACAMSAVNLAETLDQLLRVDGLEEGSVKEVLLGLIGGPIEIISLDEETAWRAAGVRARRYARKGSDLSLADCFVIATARDAELATTDECVLGAARAEGVAVRPLAGR